MVRLQVRLDPTEADALAKLAFRELRDPRDQVRLILRTELERRGLLNGEPSPRGESEKQSD